MTPVELQTCEAKVDGAWRSASLTEARGKYGLAIKRCPTCHGQIFVTSRYTAESSGLTLQHRHGHDGCPHVLKRFRGTLSPHPRAMA